MLPEDLWVNVMASEVVLASLSCSVLWTVPLNGGWRMLTKYLEVSVKAGRGCIILPLLLCPMDCPFKWRLEDATLPMACPFKWRLEDAT